MGSFGNSNKIPTELQFIKMMEIVLIVSILITNSFAKIADREGSECFLKCGVKGKCVELSKCESAQDLIKNNHIPEYCGFKNTTPLVCCSSPTPDGNDPLEFSFTNEFCDNKGNFLNTFRF